MNVRFAELIGKAKAGGLTPPEREELARALNAPVLDSLSKPPEGFVSKHSFTSSDIAGGLRAIDWFARCGEPLALDLSMPVANVPSWPEAVARCTEGAWENVELEAQNQLTVWLHQHDRESYRRWNELVVSYKADIIQPLTDGKWEPYCQRHGLDVAVVHSVQWDILGALMENAYLASGHWCFFFLELLWVYEAGHFPCGWIGDWPSGKLVVY